LENQQITVQYASGKISSAQRVKALGHFALLRPLDVDPVPPVSLTGDLRLVNGQPIVAILNARAPVRGLVTKARSTVVLSEGPGWKISPPLRFYDAIVTNFRADEETHAGAPLFTTGGQLVGMVLTLRDGRVIALPLHQMQMAVQQMTSLKRAVKTG
jgi:hypothetical protein